ncbi:MAG: DUF1858 domain-containing protein [Isosphaeraceae bacterium]
MSSVTRNRVTDPTQLVPELLREYPAARRVLDRHGLAGCGGPQGPHETLRFFARAHGIDEDRLLDEIDAVIDSSEADSCDDIGETSHAAGVADAIYRPYFLTAIAVALTAGASWGAWILWNIGLSGSFLETSVHTVNAHGEAQIYGWVGLFIMGFAYQAFPRMWQVRLPAPGLAWIAFLGMVAGILLRTVGLTTAGVWDSALAVAQAGGVLQFLAALLFATQVVVTFRRCGQRFEPYVAFVVAALACFVLSCAYTTWHTWNTMRAADAPALVAAVATYQLPLRDLQVHGLALFMILGVSLRMLPGLYDLPRVDDRRAWAGFGLVAFGLVAEMVLFLEYRWSGRHVLAAFLPVAWLAMTVGTACVVLPWRLWRALPESDRSAKFVRTAYLWLAIAMGLLLALPLYHAAAGLSFSHAYFGAARHAITVGFVSIMIMGMAARVVPTLNGVAPSELGSLWGPFFLINLGCTLRVVLQILTDWSSWAFALIGVSGTLEVISLAWWGFGLAYLILRGWHSGAEGARSVRPRPDRIEGGHVVSDVVGWYPELTDTLAGFGFTALRNPLLRHAVARQVTLARAARLRGVALDALLAALNGAAPVEPAPMTLTVLPVESLRLEVANRKTD